MKPLVKPEHTLAQGALIEPDPWESIARLQKLSMSSLYGKFAKADGTPLDEEALKAIPEPGSTLSNRVEDARPFTEEDVEVVIEKARNENRSSFFTMDLVSEYPFEFLKKDLP